MKVVKTKTKLIKFVVGVVFLSLVLANFTYAQAAYSAGTLVSMTNSARTRNGLGVLTSNSKLSSAAYAKAQDMITNQYFAHTSPSGKTPWDFIKGAGYNYSYAGENLAIGYTDASELFNAWMASATHRQNILNPNFREIGIAVVSGTYEGAETIVVAQEFGTPLEGGEVASQTATPANGNTNQPQANQSANPTPTPAPSSQPAAFVREKSSFSPQTIFAGEEVSFQATITGDVQSLEAQVFDQKINLLEAGSVTGSNGEKTYTIRQKIERVGTSDVKVVLKDKSGQSAELILGKLTVNSTVIAKNTGEQQTGMFAGFKNSLKNYWIIYTIILTGLVVTGIGLIILRKHKLGKRITATWMF